MVKERTVLTLADEAQGGIFLLTKFGRSRLIKRVSKIIEGLRECAIMQELDRRVARSQSRSYDHGHV